MTRFCVDYCKLNDVTHKDAYPYLTLMLPSTCWLEIQHSRLAQRILVGGGCRERPTFWVIPLLITFIRDFAQIAKPLHRLTEHAIESSTGPLTVN